MSAWGLPPVTEASFDAMAYREAEWFADLVARGLATREEALDCIRVSPRHRRLLNSAIEDCDRLGLARVYRFRRRVERYFKEASRG